MMLSSFKLERVDGTLEDHILSMRDEAEKEVEEALDLMRQKGRWMLETQVLTLIGKWATFSFDIILLR